MIEKKQIPEVSLARFLKHSLDILKNPLPFHNDNFEQLGNTFRLNISFKDSVLFSRDAGLLQYVLQKNQRNYTKSSIQTEDLAKYVGKGLLTAEGAQWQTQRKLIQPAFHKKQLMLLLNNIKAAITSEILKIETHKDFDIFPVMNDLAFQTVAKSLFSSAINEEEINQVQHITEAAQKMLVRELRQPYLGWYFKASGKIEKHVALTREARVILRKLISERKKGDTRYDDLLDMLLDARYEDGSVMEKEQLIDELLILFTAGHETTSNALTFAAQLLARHPEVQEKIAHEISNFTSQDLMQSLKESSYTQAVIEESMRLYPPAYFIDRVNIEDDTFQDMKIPKGSSLLFSVYEIHKDPTFWQDPLLFKPERFIGVTKNTYSSHYFPFGAGPRMCIGNNFAMYEMIIAVQTIVAKFKIAHKTSEIEITPLITLKPKNAILQFEER